MYEFEKNTVCAWVNPFYDEKGGKIVRNKKMVVLNKRPNIFCKKNKKIEIFNKIRKQKGKSCKKTDEFQDTFIN